MPEAWDGVQLWLRVCDRWAWRTSWKIVKGAMMPIPLDIRAGLDYGKVHAVLDRAAAAQDWDAAHADEVLAQLQIMERAALPILQARDHG